MSYRDTLSTPFISQRSFSPKATMNHAFIYLEIASFTLISTVVALDSHTYGFWNALAQRPGVLLWVQHVVVFVVFGFSLLASRGTKNSVFDIASPPFLTNRYYLFLKGCFSITWIVSMGFLIDRTVHPWSDAVTNSRHKSPSWESNALAVAESVLLVIFAAVHYVAFKRSCKESGHMQLPQ
ncbi:hypothetical protein BDV93DRAFT_525828 [Ceratobasidium sp. AG-I]|nr:hypothetical protein BDV93DRAFT_525828 [Ceratobasidium sp. AG-I]